MIAWGASCVLLAVVLVLAVCGRIPALRRRPEAPRQMLRADELLWHKGAEDGEGVITLGLLQECGGQLGVLVDVDGEAAGVRLDRDEVQGLRDALTTHLITTSTRVQP